MIHREVNNTEMAKKLINWKLFLILLIASSCSAAAVLPYTLTLQADLLKEVPVPLSVLLLVQIIQSVILFAVFIFIGLSLSKRVGLGLPILESWLEGKEVKGYFQSILGISIILGVLVGIIIIGLDFLFSIIGVQITIAQVAPPIWQGFLASFYGGIGEEVAMRLFLMTLLVWIFYKIRRTEDDKPTNIGMWLAIIITAVLFGIGHLPITAALTTITPLVVARAILLNGVAGIAFGWLYWKKGLESAMIAHFSADILLHVILPLF